MLNDAIHYIIRYLGNWQLKDLKDPMSRVVFPNLELADATEASEPMASLGPLEKAAILL